MKRNQKLLSIIFTLMLLVSTILSPINVLAASTNEDESTAENEQSISDLSQSDYSDVDLGDEDDNDNQKATTENLDQEPEKQKLLPQSETESNNEKSVSSNVQERAPPVTVKVRVETNTKTLVPPTEITTDSFELMEYIDGNNGGNSVFPDTPRAIHALIKALETIDGFDGTTGDLGLNSGGNYISSVFEDGEFTGGQMSGWMYFIDNSFVPVGVLDHEITDGESIVLFFMEDFTDNTVAWFDNEAYEVSVGEPLELTVNGVIMSVPNPVEGATILVDDQPFEIDGEPVLSDSDGKATVKFTEPGTYHLATERFNDAGDGNVTRAYAEVTVTENDKSALEEEISEADKIELSQMTSESKEAFETALAEAQSVINNPSATTEEIEAAIDALQDAIDNLEEIIVDKTELENLISEAKEIDLDDYTEESKEDFEVAIAEAQAALDDADVTQEKVDESLSQLQNAIDELEEIDEEASITIQERIDMTIDYMLQNRVQSEWEAIGIARAGKSVPSYYEDTFNNHLNSQVINQLEQSRAKITDIERLTIAAVALGKDPSNLEGTNLIEAMYDSAMRNPTMDSMTLQGNNGPIFGLIALDSNDFDVPSDAKWTRQKLIDELLKNQNDDGSWALNPSFPSASNDITAMAIISLAPYKDQNSVKDAIENAMAYLSSVQIDEGGFSEAFVGGVSSETTSQAIIGLTAYGKDPKSAMFTKNDNDLIDHLISFQNEDGGFAHIKGTGSNGMATEQALQALVAYQLFLDDAGRLYDFTNIDNTVDKSSLEKAIETAKKVNLDGKTEESIKQLEDTLVEARKLLEDDEATEEKISQMVDEIYEAISNLEDEAEETIDKSKLSEVLDEANKIEKEKYTDESVEKLETQIGVAEWILASNDIKQVDVDNAFTSLQAAIDGLEEKPGKSVSKEELEKLVEDAEAMDKSDKSEDSLAAFEKALGEAKAVLADDNAGQTEVDQAVSSLQAAIDGLEVIPDESVSKEELEKIIKDAEALNKSDKTEDSLAAFEKALEEAKAVLADDNASQAEVDKVVENLGNSIDDLKEKGTVDPGEGNNANEENTGKTDDSDEDTSTVEKNENKTTQVEESNLDQDDELPKTATSNYTLLLVGFVVLLIAGILLFASRKKISE